jgi:hypothetical protein
MLPQDSMMAVGDLAMQELFGDKFPLLVESS